MSSFLEEFCMAIRQRRLEIGLSQDRLAELSGLSRGTITSLETGRLRNLSLTRAQALAEVVGLRLSVLNARAGDGANSIEAAARVASVSYGTAIPPAVLEEALREGILPPGYLPQMRALLDEAPVALLHDAAVEIEQSHGVAVDQTWKRMRTLARVLKCERDLWA